MVLPVQDTQFIADHELDFGRYRFYRNLIIGEVFEGAKMDFDKILPLLAIAALYYSEENPFVYLSDRKSSYSLDPPMHREIHKLFPFLLGYGVIVYNDLNYRVARLEQRFLQCPSGLFRSTDEAVAWAAGLIENKP
jgi:hypothetical protein